MNLLIYLTFLLFSLGQLGRLSFFDQTINGYAYEIPMFGILVYLFFRFRLNPIKKALKHFPIFFWFIGILSLSYLLSFFSFSLVQNTTSILYLFRLIFYLSFFAYLCYFAKHETHLRKTLTYGIIIYSVLTVIVSFIQYFLYPDLRNLLYLGWDPHLARMFGLFFDTSVAAAIYGLLFFFFFDRYNLPFISLFFAGFILTFSRSAYIVLTILIFFHFISQKKFALLLIFLAAFLIAVLIAPKQFGEGVNLKRTFSIQSRLNDYKEAIEIWKKSPILGVGYNRIRYVKPNSPTGHAAASFSSSYLIILTTGGILGLLGFMGVLGKLWLISGKARGIVVFLAALSFADNIILHPFILFLVGAVIMVSINPLSGKSLR